MYAFCTQATIGDPSGSGWIPVGVAVVVGSSTWRSSRWLPLVLMLEIGRAVVSNSLGHDESVPVRAAGRHHRCGWPPTLPTRAPIMSAPFGGITPPMTAGRLIRLSASAAEDSDPVAMEFVLGRLRQSG